MPKKKAKKQRLSREGVLRMALRIVDEEGLSALSMRRLGTELGVEAMSLYRHVENKTDLLDNLHGRVLAEMRPPKPTGDWTEDLRRAARELRRVLMAHPNAAILFANRPPVTEDSLSQLQGALAVLSNAGFSAHEAPLAFKSVFTFVIGHIFYFVGRAKAARALEYHALPAEQYPVLVRMADALSRDDADDAFEFGLEVLLSGLRERLVGSAPSS